MASLPDETRRQVQWHPPVSYLPRPILEPRNVAAAVLVGWLTALIPSLLLSAVVNKLLPHVATPDLKIQGAATFSLVVVISPIIETCIMGGVLALLLRFVPPTAAVLLSALAWGIAHSVAAPAWGLVIWWPFVVFSTLFVTWRQRSLALALVVPACAHALQNLLPSLILLSGIKSPV